MKKTFALIIALALVISCAACGKTPNSDVSNDAADSGVQNENISQNTQESQTSDVGNETEDTDIFVPDYTEGNENKGSFLSFNMLWIQQDGWLYYGASDGDHHGLHGEDTLLKMPVGGSQEDVVKIYDCYDAEETIYNFDCTCGNRPYNAEIEQILAVMGDWVYLQIGDANDGHIYRLRTDGKLMEQVLCLCPDENTTRYYWAMRDNFLYFMEESTVQLDASTEETKQTINALVLDATPQEIKNLTNAPVLDPNSFCNPGNFTIDGDYYFKNDLDGQYYCFTEDEQFVLLTDITYSYKDKSIYEDMVDSTVFPLLAVGGLDGKIYFYGGLEKNFVPESGLYLLGDDPWQNMPSNFTLTGDERDNDTTWAVLQPYLLPNSEGVMYPKVLAVDGGLVFGGYDSELQFYSFETGETTKINNDGDVSYMAWPGDGYLYYSFHDEPIYRVKLDGSGWEDVSWITTVPVAP